MAANLFADYQVFFQEAERLAETISYPGPALLPAYRRQVAILFAQAQAQLFATNVARPEWVPHTGALFPWGAPNPDTIYAFAPVESHGVYRISGRQGTEDIASVMPRRNGANTGQVHGAPLGEIDLNAEPADATGYYSFLLSQQRPEGYEGRWHPLHADATGLTLRRVTSRPEQVDGSCAVFRLDAAVAPDAAALEATMLQFASRLNEFLLGYVKKLRGKGLVNRLEAEAFKENGGLRDQLYYQGLFDIASDEALIVASALPPNPRYWSVQLLDPFYSAVNFVSRQSSLNGHQARLDDDGHARLVVSMSDPGVPNWLDTGGWLQGAMMWRWNAKEFPEPTIRRVKLSELRAHLPPSTPAVSPAERQEFLGKRAEHYQMRRRW